MADTLINTLYPPIADTFMPAFVNTSNEVRIYFSLSPYNTPEMVKKIHVSLVDQKTNKYVLQDVGYQSEYEFLIVQGILIKDVSSGMAPYLDEASGLYYVSIPKEFLAQEYSDSNSSTESVKTTVNWKTEIYYQAQIRLDCSEKSISSNNFIASDYILDERQYFSEWSSVILLRAIPRPVLFFKALDDAQQRQNPKEKTSSDGRKYYSYDQVEIQSYNKGFIPIAAEVIWQMDYKTMPTNTEYLNTYRITIFAEGENENIVDSGILHVGNNEKDSIYYLADMNNASENMHYVIHIDATTRNGYEWFDEKTIEIAQFSTGDFNLNWTFSSILLNSYGDVSEKIITEEDGFVTGQVESIYDMPPGYLYIFRSNSNDNYTTNEIIQVTSQNGQFTQTFVDKTVSSLISYRYKAQYHYKTGIWSKVINSKLLVYPDFYDMLFLRQDKQLAVRFNGAISSLKPVVNRVKIDTLGSKYPKFAENARMNYKQFSISGLISAEEDFNKEFLNYTDEKYADSLEAYSNNIGNEYLIRNDTVQKQENILNKGFTKADYNKTDDSGKKIHERYEHTLHSVYLHNNWYWEREFRENVISWLNDGEPKLFRSMTEGNMVVMLTDISLTPNKTLGRRLYDFSATMYEIEKGDSLAILDKYGIYTVRNDEEAKNKPSGGSGGDSGDDDEESLIDIVQIHQYNIISTPTLENTDLVSGSKIVTKGSEVWVDPITIQDLLNAKYSGVLKNRKVKPGTINISNLKIQFTSKPYWINNDETLSIADIESEELTPDSNILLGYKFQVKIANDDTDRYKTIFVNSKGYYQIPSDLKIIGLKFFNNETYELNYTLNYQLQYSSENLITKTEKIKDVIGQYSGTFYPNVALGETIRRKYHQIEYRNIENLSYISSEQLMQYWTGISLDVTPYTLCALKETADGEWQERLVGQTGVYNLMTDFETHDIKILGRRMVRSKEDTQQIENTRPYLDEWEYVLDSSVLHQEEDFYSPYWFDYVGNPSTSSETEYIVYIRTEDMFEKRQPKQHWSNLAATDDESIYGYLLIGNIKNPQYNTIYKVLSRDQDSSLYVIYYIDQAWYKVEFLNDDFSICLAQVPTYGAINYRGTVMKQTFNV